MAGVLGVVTAAACAVSGCGPGEAPGGPSGDAVSASARLLPPGPIPPGTWCELRIELENAGRADLERELIVREAGRGTAGRTLVRTPLVLPHSSRRRRVLPLQRRGTGPLEVVVAAPHLRRSFPVPPPPQASAGEARVLVVDPETRPAGTLAGLLQSPGDTEPEVEVIAPGALPLHPAGYGSFGLVVLREATLDRVPDAVEALATWVESGGTVLALPGFAWSTSLPPPLARLLGLDDVGASQVPPWSRRAGPRAAKRGQEPSEPPPPPRSGTWRPLRPAPRAVTALDGLTADHRHGVGGTRTLAWTPETFDEELEGTRVHGALRGVWRWACVTKRQIPPPGSAAEGSITETLLFFAWGDLPGQGLMGLLFLAYLALGVILPVKLAARRGRAEWGYAVSAGVALLLIIGLVRFGLGIAVRSAQERELTLIALAPGAEHARVARWMELVAPQHEEVAIDPPGPADARAFSLVSPLVAARGPGPGAAPGRLETAVETDGDVHVPRLALYPHAPRRLRQDATVPVETLGSTPRVRRAGDGSGDLVVENRRARWLELWLLEGKKRWSLGTLPPSGAARRIRERQGSDRAATPGRSGQPELTRVIATLASLLEPAGGAISRRLVLVEHGGVLPPPEGMRRDPSASFSIWIVEPPEG